MHWSDLASRLAPIAVMLAIFASGMLIELLVPAERSQPLRHSLFNIIYSVLTGWFHLAAAPILGVAATAIVNGCGGGWITLPATGGLLFVSAAVYIIAIDFMEFAFHRAQHAVPFLWALHSFHHSDPSVNITTAVRNHWLEIPIKAIFVYPILAILFKVPAGVLTIYAITTIWHSVNHLNVRWRVPIPWAVLNNPQYHRLHHSILPEHHNKNFSAYFPVWDILCGTARAPQPNQYPQTGLEGRGQPASVAQALIWPWSLREPVFRMFRLR